MIVDEDRIKAILEGALLAAGKPLSIEQIEKLFPDLERPSRESLRKILAELCANYAGRACELVEVASGWRLQIRQELEPWITRLWEERPPRYSRALLETIALIAYRQPITRAEIENVRGVAVSTHIMKTLLEREWVRVLGHREVPGRPALYGTTRQFLDYFNLKSLDDLPTLAEIKDLDKLHLELEFGDEIPDGEEADIAPRAIMKEGQDLAGAPPGEVLQ